MKYSLLEFEWDIEKAARNLRKHGVSFEEAASVFNDVHATRIRGSGQLNKRKAVPDLWHLGSATIAHCRLCG